VSCIDIAAASVSATPTVRICTELRAGTAQDHVEGLLSKSLYHVGNNFLNFNSRLKSFLLTLQLTRKLALNNQRPLSTCRYSPSLAF